MLPIDDYKRLIFLKIHKNMYFYRFVIKISKTHPHWAFCFGFSSGLVTKLEKMKTGKRRKAGWLCCPQPFSLLSKRLLYFLRAALKLQIHGKIHNIVKVQYLFLLLFNLWFTFITFESFNAMVYNKYEITYFSWNKG